jgi:hypothetical protein
VGTASTTITVPAPDDAFSAFKAAEGNYVGAVGAQTSASSALATAQSNAATANANVEQAATAVKEAADQLIASLQTFEAGLPAPTPAAS